MNDTVVACVDGSPSTGPVCDYTAFPYLCSCCTRWKRVSSGRL